jgi:osmotically-inducible protein OsmY
MAAETGSRFQSSGYVSSEQLLERVRSKMGHLVAQPALIQVLADANGSVTLTGAVAADESDELIAAIEAIPGVCLVINRLDVNSERSNPGQSVPNA